MQLTRRKLAAAVLSPAALALPQPQTQTQPPDELTAARQRMKDNALALAKIDVQPPVEPAFQFKA
jgi:hypothetical protein